jgi:Na+/glutamate symporter
MFPTLSTIGETPAIPAVPVLASSGLSARAASRRLRRIGAALAILVATAMPYAHAQSASSTSEAANVETAPVTGTVAANASLTASTATAPGIAKTDNLAIGVTQPKSEPSNEPMPFHPLTDF